MLAKKILEIPSDVNNEEEHQFVGHLRTAYGNPDLLAISTDAKDIHELVTPVSRRFLKILYISPEFMNSLPQQWLENAAYMKASDVATILL